MREREMLGNARRRQRSSLPYRIPLWGAVLLVGALVYLDNSPFLIEPSSDEAGGTTISRTRTSDVVVVLDYRRIGATDTTFRKRDWSGAWVDMLEQHLGPITVVTPESLASKHLKNARAIVLTASVTGEIPESLATELREQALDGSLLVVDRPEGKLREMFAANGEAGTQIGRNITFARGVKAPFKSQLTSMPIDTEYIGSTSPKDDSKTLLAIDGAPVVYSVAVGEGHVVTVDFDIGEQLVAMQQGRPSEDWRVEAGNVNTDELPPKTSDLVGDDKLRGAEIPYADLLERFIVYGVIQRYAPIPSLWPFPGDALGVVVPIHEDQSLGDGGGWMLEYETDNDGTSTLFSSVDAGLTAAGSAVIDRRGGEIGLLWKLPKSPEQLTQSYGIWGLEPVAQPRSLQQQIDSLTKTIPADHIRSTKTARRWWTPEWSRPFRLLAKQGVSLDVSYEPRRVGFSFGTGFPFRVHDRTGLPLPIRELPVVVPGARVEGMPIGKLLAGSQNGHHQILTYSLAPASFGAYPDMQRFDAWVESFEEIRRTGHIIRNTTQLLSFWRGRLGSSLGSQLIEDVALPEGKDTSTEEADEKEEETSQKGVMLRIEAEVKRNDLSLTVPDKIGDRSFVQARQRASRVAGNLVARKIATEPETVVGFSFRRIPVDAGSTRIDVYYR